MTMIQLGTCPGSWPFPHLIATIRSPSQRGGWQAQTKKLEEENQKLKESRSSASAEDWPLWSHDRVARAGCICISSHGDVFRKWQVPLPAMTETIHRMLSLRDPESWLVWVLCDDADASGNRPERVVQRAWLARQSRQSWLSHLNSPLLSISASKTEFTIWT